MAFKLNIGTPKEPTKSLADQLKINTVISHAKDMDAAMDTLTKPLQAPTGKMQGMSNLVATSPLAAALEKKPATMPVPVNAPPIESTSTIPVVTAEKYSLLAEACDTLDQKTIDQFNTRMQFLEVAFDNDELPDAMKRVLEYCQEHQELRPFLRAEDIALFVRGARKSYARVAEKKSTNRAKKSKSAIMDDNIMESLMDLDIDL